MSDEHTAGFSREGYKSEVAHKLAHYAGNTKDAAAGYHFSDFKIDLEAVKQEFLSLVEKNIVPYLSETPEFRDGIYKLLQIANSDWSDIHIFKEVDRKCCEIIGDVFDEEAYMRLEKEKSDSA